MKMLVLDGNSLVNRAYYGIRSTMTSPDGTATNAVFGFFMMLRKLENLHSPNRVAVAFDLPQPTFRHEMFDGYKATRHPAPDDLREQFPIIRELLADLGYPTVTCPGYEADDILGTLSRLCAAQEDDCVLCTGDRDSYQLISSHVTVEYATQSSDSDLWDEARIREKYGVSPEQLIQVKALMGDSSDNIPGVPGIGEKTALALIAEFGSVDGVYAHLDAPSIKAGARKKLEEGRASADMSLRLAAICREAPVDPDLSSYDRQPGNRPKAAHRFAALGMVKLIENLGLTELAASEPAPIEPEQTNAPECAECAAAAFANCASARRETKAYTVSVGPDGLTGWSDHPDANGVLDLLLDEQAAVFSRFDPSTGELRWCSVPRAFGEAELKTLLQCPLRVHDPKEVAALCAELSLPSPDLRFSTELAAYLLDANASSYAPDTLYGLYDVPSEAEGAGGESLRFARLCDALEGKIRDNGQTGLLRGVELPLAIVLADMERLGFAVDRDGIATFGTGLLGDIDRLTENIYREAGGEFNINSPKQLGEVLFERLGLPCKKKTKSGYSTNVDALEALRPIAPIVGDVLEYRKLAKLKSTYVEGLLKQISPDGRIHSSFNQTETRTGRISSTEPNLQNIPVRTEQGRKMRRFFVAQPGWVLLDADYSQIELRVLASIADDPAMTGAFLSGADIHTQTAAQVFGLPADMITPELRRRAKAVNFGIVYGISAHSLGEDIGVSYGEAAQYIRDYLKTYAGVDAYMKRMVILAREQGYVTTLSGRRRNLPELKSSNANLRAFGERVAMNTPIQGTAADVIKIAMVRVHDRLAREGLRARLILQVHDELLVEAPEDEADRAASILREEMEHAADFKVPLLADVHQGHDWYTAKG